MTPTRRTPLPRKRATKRKSKAARCSVLRCKRRPSAAGMCLTHLKREADRLFSLKVREPGACARCGAVSGLQCSHFISRRYLGVRFNLLNAEPLCAACHKFLTERPLEARVRAEGELGSLVYAELVRIALAFTGPLDYGSILSRLRGGDDDR